MKKFLLSLFVWLIWFIGFWYCSLEVIIWWVNSKYWSTNFSLPKPWTSTLNQTIDPYSSICLKIPSTSSYCTYNWINYSWNAYTVCFLNNSDSSVSFSISCTNTTSSTTTVQYTHSPSFSSYVWWSCPECPTCEDPYTSEQCQYLYDLIPVEDIDINYCVWNWLCPNECWSGDNFSWDLQFSNIFINNILHPWRENIFIDIPDYIYWDYSVNTWDFNLYVWSWYDQDYIDWVLSINTYKPSSEDFTQVFVSWLTLIFPYIFVVLFIIFVWKLLKRVFK